MSLGSDLSGKGGAPVHLPKAFLVVLAVTVILIFLPRNMLKRPALTVLCPVLAVMTGLNVFSVINRPECRVVFADVGQGDCCLIMTHGKTCLIDAGTCEEGASTVADLLDHYGISKVDVCVMSHWDVDHSGGIAALCVQGRTKTILTSYVPSADAQHPASSISPSRTVSCQGPRLQPEQARRISSRPDEDA